MKQINFLTTLSPHEQRAIVRWYRCTLGATLAVVGGILSAQLYQGYQVYTLKHQLNALPGTHTPSVQQPTLTHEKTTLAAHLDHMRSTQSFSHHQALQTCTRACTPACSLRSYQTTGNTLTITIACQQPRDALTMANTLQKNGLFSDVKLVRLQTQEKPSVGILAHLKATLTTPTHAT